MTTPRTPAEKGPLFRAAWEDQVSDPESRAGIQRAVTVMRAVLAGEVSAPAEDETIEELAARIAVERQAALAAKAVEGATDSGMLDFEIQPPKQPAPQPRTWERNQGGAFGGALKRRIEAADIAGTDRGDIAQADFDAVSYESLRHELLVSNSEQARAGVLFTSDEFGSLTFSPRTLASRVAGHVIVGTQGRNQDSRVDRVNEVVSDALQGQLQKIDDLITSLSTDRDVAKTLEDEMKSPGYAHMTVAEMGGLMSHVEGKVRAMVDAVAMDRSVGADRLKGINAAIDYRLGDPSYRTAFEYWQDMTNLSGQWARRKLKVAEKMKKNLEAEIATRP